jgi:DNA-binding response OmpR family regulator
MEMSCNSLRRVLIVDDIEDNRVVLERQLRRAGFATEQCVDGVSALNMIDRWRPDVVLLDWMMPGLSGLETLKAIRDRQDENELPVIMCTALDEESSVVSAIKSGANDYVTKPINLPILLARMKAQLARKQAIELLRRQKVDLESLLAKRTKDLLERRGQVQT